MYFTEKSSFIEVLSFPGVHAASGIPVYIFVHCTVKRVNEVVRHPHLVTQDQFTQVSKKVFDIPEENFTINIKLFQQNFTFVELLCYKHVPHVEICRG
jgi:hypothetical protein